MKKLLIISIVFQLANFAWAGPEDIDRYVKCYMQFVGEPVSPNDSILKSMKENSGISGVEACKKVLAKASLKNGSLDQSSIEDGKKILHNFNILHRSFFANLAKSNYSGWRKYIYDGNDRSYYLLKALFSVNQSGESDYVFKNIFTDNNVYKAERQGGPYGQGGMRMSRVDSSGQGLNDHTTAYALCGGHQNTPAECDSVPFKYNMIDSRVLARAGLDESLNIVDSNSHGLLRDGGGLFNISEYGYYKSVTGSGDGHTHYGMVDTLNWAWGFDDLVESGDIIGLSVQQAKEVPNVFLRNLNDYGDNGYQRNYLGPLYKQTYPAKNSNIYDNLGTGILFPPSYQAMLGLDNDAVLTQNGVDLINREWPQDVLKDFFCRDIPVVRISDAAKVTSSTFNAKTAFRSQVSCMKCHATIDALSTISRNYKYVSPAARNGRGSKVNHFFEPTMPAIEEWPAEPVSHFALTPAFGYFRYRDYYGNIKDDSEAVLRSTPSDPKKAFRDFASLVQSYDDPYICMTSKYLKYLTGIEMTFYDPGDGAPTLSPRDQAIKDYVFQLGKNLKQNGDLRSVVLDIVSQDFYLDPVGK